MALEQRPMPTPPYEILEHTADVGLKVYGGTQAELFENAAAGLVNLALLSENEGPGDDAGTRLLLSANGTDLEDLLVNWLSEVLYHIDAEGWEFRRFRVADISETVVHAEAFGNQQSRMECSRPVAVKAITYHQISVKRAAGWEAVVYFDV
jgi:SHS2 domain-containing protein